MTPQDFANLSDLVRQSGETQRILEITVDRFALVNGTTTLEDRALPAPRTWRSENITVEAFNLSSRPQYGSAVATSVTGGAIETNDRRTPVGSRNAASATGIPLMPWDE